MKISYNEILTATQKIFEGAGYSPGHYTDAAEMIGWLAIHGISEWQSIIGQLNNKLSVSHTISTRSLYQDENSIILDGQGDSALFCGALAAEFAYLKAVEQPIGIAKLQQCRHPLSILAHLSQYAQRGMYSLAQWFQCDQHFLVRFVVGQPLPYIFVTEKTTRNLRGVAQNSLDDQYLSCDLPKVGQDTLTDITILFSTKVEFSIQDQNATLYYSPNQLRQKRLEQLEVGIEIDELLWQKLQEQSKSVLVEATDESRQRGAGEDAAI